MIAKEPTAAVRLPQLPLQSTKALSIDDLAEQVIDIVIGLLAFRQDDGFAGARGGAAHAVGVLAVRDRGCR